MFCPHCGRLHIEHFQNNKPVADFYCPKCHREYELKSKNGKIHGKINDGAYDTMIRRITSNNNPDFFFMSYSKEELCVTDFIFVPKYFFVPDIIEKRKPLAETAKRAGWVGCNILIDQIPVQGRIEIISNSSAKNPEDIISRVNNSRSFETSNINARGWLVDILRCVNRIPSETFTLREIYEYENGLGEKYPENNNIRAKIRQQLQILRDRGIIEFLGNGIYKKLVSDF